MVPIHFDTFVNSLDRVGEAVTALQRQMVLQDVAPERVCITPIGGQCVIVPR
jgi:hypothetical protein